MPQRPSSKLTTISRAELVSPRNVLSKTFYQNSNLQGGRAAFLYKTKYSINAYSDFNGEQKAIYDFNIGERLLYGRINKNNTPVILRREDANGKVFGNIKTGEIAIDFVADAFNEVIRQFDIAKLDGRLREDDTYSNFKVSKSFTNPYYLYDRTTQAMYNQFLKFLDDNNLDVKIFNYKTFLTHYFMFLESTSNTVPFTLTGFMKSRYCPPIVTGLVVEVSNGESCANDYIKYNNYISSDNFCLFASIAMNHGFRIDKNVPWRLVADINSPAMNKHMRKRLMFSGNQVLEYYFHPAHHFGYERFKNLARLFYNSLARKKQLITVHYTCSNGKVKTRAVKRMPISPARDRSLYDDNYWIEKYIQIRNLEEQNYLSEAVMNKLIKDSKNLLVRGNINDVLDFAENKIINFDVKPGSFSDTANKIKLRDAAQSDIIRTTGIGSSGGGGGGGY